MNFCRVPLIPQVDHPEYVTHNVVGMARRQRASIDGPISYIMSSFYTRNETMRKHPEADETEETMDEQQGGRGGAAIIAPPANLRRHRGTNTRSPVTSKGRRSGRISLSLDHSMMRLRDDGMEDEEAFFAAVTNETPTGNGRDDQEHARLNYDKNNNQQPNKRRVIRFSLESDHKDDDEEEDDSDSDDETKNQRMTRDVQKQRQLGSTMTKLLTTGTFDPADWSSVSTAAASATSDSPRASPEETLPMTPCVHHLNDNESQPGQEATTAGDTAPPADDDDDNNNNVSPASSSLASTTRTNPKTTHEQKSDDEAPSMLPEYEQRLHNLRDNDDISEEDEKGDSVDQSPGLVTVHYKSKGEESSPLMGPNDPDQSGDKHHGSIGRRDLDEDHGRIFVKGSDGDDADDKDGAGFQMADDAASSFPRDDNEDEHDTSDRSSVRTPIVGTKTREAKVGANKQRTPPKRGRQKKGAKNPESQEDGERNELKIKKKKKKKKRKKEVQESDSEEQTSRRKGKTSKNMQHKMAYFSPKGIPAGPREFTTIPVSALKASRRTSNGDEEQQAGLRRSQRARLAPLEFWKNERIIYGPNDFDEELYDSVTNMPVPMAISRAEPTPYKPRKKRSTETTSKAKKKDNDTKRAIEDVPFDSTELRKKYHFIDGSEAWLWNDATDEKRDHLSKSCQRISICCFHVHLHSHAFVSVFHVHQRLCRTSKIWSVAPYLDPSPEPSRKARLPRWPLSPLMCRRMGTRSIPATSWGI